MTSLKSAAGVVLASLPLLASHANAAGLVDNPIVGSHIQYLDTTVGGLKWTASTNFSTTHACAFQQDMDYDQGPVGQTAHVNSAQQCCDACAAAGDCAGGVLAHDTCYFKTAEELLKPKQAQGRVACLVQNKTTQSLSIAATVPGDLITDLQKAGQIGDPIYELNWLNSTIWDASPWEYTTTFSLDSETLDSLSASSASEVVLVFDGVKMGANVSLNGQNLGRMTDQFRRYTFDVSPHLDLTSGSSNYLSVTFDSAIDVGGRFMACTGGWDWAPYSNTKNIGGPNTLSKGIWKNVYLVTAQSLAIEHVVPQTFYRGAYPNTILRENDHGGFDVEVRVHLRSAVATTATVQLVPSWTNVSPKATQNVSVPAGASTVTVSTTAEAADIQLWWPANTGRDHPLYTVTVNVQEAGSDAVLSAQRTIGFRHVALVTGNDTDPAYIQNATTEEGTELGFGMFFRVNGAAIFTRGANMIPMEEFEGRMNAQAHELLVQSAVDANFNILRVWGGGMFLPDAWYDACDKAGILVYHDMQYAQQGHAPAATTDQDAELRHQIRRLASHPSIIMWDGCNECRVIMNTPTAIYATFVLTVVAEEDKSRAIWPSCPALGWTTGVDRLTARPNGNALTTPADAPPIETHGPYQHGGGFPSVNGPNTLSLFDPNIPIKISPTTRSVSEKNVYASEFGSSVMSSFESMSPTLAPEHWGLHGGAPADNCSGGFTGQCEGNNTMAQRNYPCDNIIDSYFGTMDLSKVGEQDFKKQLYLCMLGQSLLIKSNIETRRSQNELGIIVWQYNEIWPTGGWGSIEYGTPVEGQVIGGRWKPLHYLYKASIYADVMATCGESGQCYVSNDGIDSFKGTLTITNINFVDSSSTPVLTKALDMAPGIANTEFFNVDLSKFDETKSVLVANIKSSAGEVASNNVIAMAPPSQWKLPKAHVTAAVTGANITLKTDKAALYVTLTTLATGRFSDNAFLLAPGEEKTISFIGFKGQPVDLDLLKKTLRVEHLGAYL